MKIISKFKDFYDHKVAKYGIDPVLVFDRRQPSDEEILHSLPKPPAEWEKEYGACAAVSVLYVGRLRVYLFNTGARVYTSFDVAEVFRRTQPHFSRDVCPKIRFNDGSEYYLPKYADYFLSADEKFQAETMFQRQVYTPYRCCWCVTLNCASGGKGYLRITPTRNFPHSASTSIPILCGRTSANTCRSLKARPKPARACPTKPKSATRDLTKNIPSAQK